MKPYYDEGGITIYHADCRDVLPTMGPIVDVVVTSPPYNRALRIDKGWTGVQSEAAKLGRFRDGYDVHDDAMPFIEYEQWQAEMLRLMWATLADDGAIFYNHRPRILEGALWTPLQIKSGLPLRQIIVWVTGAGVNIMPGAFAGAHEWIMLLAKPAFRLLDAATSAHGDVWQIPPAKASEHPAPFPLAIPTRALTATGAESVLDPFMGSGTTLRAAKNLGCRAIGIDTSERYCEIAARRLGQEVFEFESQPTTGAAGRIEKRGARDA